MGPGISREGCGSCVDDIVAVLEKGLFCVDWERVRGVYGRSSDGNELRSMV